MKSLKIIKKLSVLLLIFWVFLLPLSIQAEFVPIFPNEEEEEEEVGGKDDGEIILDEVIYQEEEIVEDDAEITIIDESTTKSSNIYFDLTLERANQTPFGNYVPYTLTARPHIDSPRTQVIWNVPSTLQAVPRHDAFVSMQRGQEYVLQGRIRPLKEGTYDFSISVIAWQHNTNFTNSISDNVNFNRNLVLEPVSTHYQVLNTLRWVGVTVLFVGAIVLLVILAKKYMKKAKVWLTPPT